MFRAARYFEERERETVPNRERVPNANERRKTESVLNDKRGREFQKKREMRMVLARRREVYLNDDWELSVHG